MESSSTDFRYFDPKMALSKLRSQGRNSNKLAQSVSERNNLQYCTPKRENTETRNGNVSTTNCQREILAEEIRVRTDDDDRVVHLEEENLKLLATNSALKKENEQLKFEKQEMHKEYEEEIFKLKDQIKSFEEKYRKVSETQRKLSNEPSNNHKCNKDNVDLPFKVFIYAK